MLCSVFTDVQMEMRRFMSTVTNVAAKIDGQNFHKGFCIVVNNLMHARTLPILRRTPVMMSGFWYF